MANLEVHKEICTKEAELIRFETKLNNAREANSRVESDLEVQTQKFIQLQNNTEVEKNRYEDEIKQAQTKFKGVKNDYENCLENIRFGEKKLEHQIFENKQNFKTNMEKINGLKKELEEMRTSNEKVQEELTGKTSLRAKLEKEKTKLQVEHDQSVIDISQPSTSAVVSKSILKSPGQPVTPPKKVSFHGVPSVTSSQSSIHAADTSKTAYDVS